MAEQRTLLERILQDSQGTIVRRIGHVDDAAYVGPQRVGPQRVEGPKFLAFFFLSCLHFRSFFSFSLGSFCGILVVFLKRRGPAFGALGLSCETRRSQNRWVSHDTPRAHREHFRAPAFKNTTKFPRNDHQEREENAKFCIPAAILDQHRHTHTADTHSRHTQQSTIWANWPMLNWPKSSKKKSGHPKPKSNWPENWPKLTIGPSLKKTKLA